MGKLKPRDVHLLPQVPQLLLSDEMKPKHSDLDSSTSSQATIGPRRLRRMAGETSSTPVTCWVWVTLIKSHYLFPFLSFLLHTPTTCFECQTPPVATGLLWRAAVPTSRPPVLLLLIPESDSCCLYAHRCANSGKDVKKEHLSTVVGL